jgi:hypothetical protein
MADFIIFAGMQEPEHYAVRSGGQYQLASWLRDFGYTVKVIDFCFKLEHNTLVTMAEKHIDENTLAFGFSSTFWNIALVNVNGLDVGGIVWPDWIQHLRSVFVKKYPNIKWILGGANAATPVLQENDWIRIHQFAEDETLALLDSLKGLNIERPKFDIQNTVKRYSDDDFIQPYETLSIEISRGCIFKCKFCQFPLIGRKKGTNIRSEEDIKTEFIENYERFGVTKYYFSDDTFNESMEKVQMIHRISKSLPFELEYTAYIRLDLLHKNQEMIDMLTDSGLRSAFIGLETFQVEGAMAIGKGWNGKYAKDFLVELKNRWKGKANFWLGMIIGLPGWNREQEELDVKWLIENEMPCWWHWALYINPINVINQKQFTSEFEREYKKYGYEFNKPNNFVNWTNGNLDHEELINIAAEISERTEKYKKIAGFRIGEYSSTLRCKMSELVDVYETSIPIPHLRALVTDFVNTYVNKHLEK